MLHRVLSVALADTPFKQFFPVADANDKRSFASFTAVIDSWCDNRDGVLAREAALIDGEQQTTEAA